MLFAYFRHLKVEGKILDRKSFVTVFFGWRQKMSLICLYIFEAVFSGK